MDQNLPLNVMIGMIAAEPYEDVTLRDISNFNGCNQAAHVVIYADTRTPAVQKLAPRAAVYLQFRFDGHVGFPGGMLNRGERPEDAAYRELTEESGLDSEELRLTKDDLLVVHYSKSKNLLLHLFVKKVSIDIFHLLETQTVNCHEWGKEVIGVLRAPLYTMSDGYRGFPAFLDSKFIGNCKEQLLHFLDKCKIMTKEEIDLALNAKPFVLGK
ncbi:nudix (nucleoside diphosphate linked moiety X)-type motif [Nesidiocoris tenuis]|uniref:U8 snoRNA-decapping enzyme n=1 Tax=Nesidiocoris tenuis TaxID=355587 RepID=A0ABN7AT46_9HEMI|nr:nudix (nucleoside diphosphate linked moiety X)-type motif [Nesidiocoris tenuis]